MMPSERGRVTRSGSQYTLNRHGFNTLVKDKYTQWHTYIDRLLCELKTRFEPWPEWLLKCNIAFNFDCIATDDDRRSALKTLMDCPTGPHPLVQEEKDRILSEYVTFALNAERVKTDSPNTLTQTELNPLSVNDLISLL